MYVPPTSTSHPLHCTWDAKRYDFQGFRLHAMCNSQKTLVGSTQMHFSQQVEPKNLVLIDNLSKFAKIAQHFEQPRLKKTRKRGAAEPPPAAKRRRPELARKTKQFGQLHMRKIPSGVAGGTYLACVFSFKNREKKSSPRPDGQAKNAGFYRV